MSEHARTPRGFRLFHDAEIVVQESSLAFEGAHAWIRGGRPIDNDGGRGVLHVNVRQAAAIVAGLETFIAEARGGELTEPVSVGEGAA